uniref:SEA domain-containing protein n=1 Tax=Zosterops lateralis melanops TaxID=1220523 RepID=A0A8D2PAR1_ZOSLA
MALPSWDTTASTARASTSMVMRPSQGIFLNKIVDSLSLEVFKQCLMKILFLFYHCHFLFSLAAVKSITTQSPGAATEHFTLNFTITNLMFTTDLQTPNSRKFQSTEKIMKHYVSQNSVKLYDIKFLRPGKNRDSTGVDTICSYGKGTQVPKFNPAEVYQELKRMTNGITKLGIYSLDNKSLYVNGECLIFPLLHALEQSGTTLALRDHLKVKKVTLRRV